MRQHQVHTHTPQVGIKRGFTIGGRAVVAACAAAGRGAGGALRSRTLFGSRFGKRCGEGRGARRGRRSGSCRCVLKSVVSFGGAAGRKRTIRRVCVAPFSPPPASVVMDIAVADDVCAFVQRRGKRAPARSDPDPNTIGNGNRTNGWRRRGHAHPRNSVRHNPSRRLRPARR